MGALQVVLAIAGTLSAMIGSWMWSKSHQNSQVTNDWNKFVEYEAARSAIELMESALWRRMWEMPPNAKCQKSLTTGASGTIPVLGNEKAHFTVKASLDLDSQIITLSAAAIYPKPSWFDFLALKDRMNTTLEKRLKVWDASSYLYFSKSPNPTYLSRHLDKKSSVALIGDDRKIHFEGPVMFKSATGRDANFDWNPATTTPLVGGDAAAYPGIILQSERVTLGSSVQYAFRESTIPEPNSNPELDLLAPYANTHYATFGFGAAFITSDAAAARATRSAVQSGNSALFPPSIKSGIYPMSFACTTSDPKYSSLPIKANDQTWPDTGCYINDVEKWRVWEYSYNGAASHGFRADFTCLTDEPAVDPVTKLPTNRKHCSTPARFPAGYSQWLSDSNLQTTLVTDPSVIETDAIEGAITWDHFEALEQDAKTCGLHVPSQALPTQVDCDLSNANMWDRYLNNEPACESFTIFNSSQFSALNNFDVSDYNGTNSTDPRSLLRRVIYAKDPLELSQESAEGLAMGTSLSDPTARERLSIWIVNENRTVLRPYQTDLREMKDTNYVPRTVYFNEDSTGAATPLKGLKLISLSPELTEVITPTRVRFTEDDLNVQYPKVVVNGETKIKPRNHIFTDHVHQNDDGFKYGFRNVKISNFAQILPHNNTAQSGTEAGESTFYLNGLWGATDSTDHRRVRNACYFDKPGDGKFLDDSGQDAVYVVTADPDNEAGTICGAPSVNTPLKAETILAAYGGSSPDLRLDAAPPSGSRFYYKTPTGVNCATRPSNSLAANDEIVLENFYPAVFEIQRRKHKVTESSVSHTGLVVRADFDSTEHNGRNLASALSKDRKFLPITRKGEADISDRSYIWDKTYHYENTGGTAACSDTGIKPLRANKTIVEVYPMVSVDYSSNSQLAPEVNEMRSLGAIFAADLPTLELRRTP